MGKNAEFGWFAYTPLTPTPANGAGADDGPFEAADVGRLARRGMRSVVRAARADLAPTVAGELREHLGPVPPDAPVVTEAWSKEGMLPIDEWIARAGALENV